MALNSRYIDLKTGLFAISKEDLKAFFDNYAADLGSDYSWDSSWDNMTAKDLWKKSNGKWANQKYIDLWRKAALVFESNPGVFGRFTLEALSYNENPRTVTDTPFRDNDALTANNQVSGDWRKGGYYNFDKGVDINGNLRPAYMTMQDGDYARNNNYEGIYNGNGSVVASEPLSHTYNRKEIRLLYNDSSPRRRALMRRLGNGNLNSRAINTLLSTMGDNAPKLNRLQRRALAYSWNNNNPNNLSASAFGLTDDLFNDFNERTSFLKRELDSSYAEAKNAGKFRIGGKLIKHKVFIK